MAENEVSGLTTFDFWRAYGSYIVQKMGSNWKEIFMCSSNHALSILKHHQCISE